MEVKFERPKPKEGLRYDEIPEGKTFVCLNSEPYVHMKSCDACDVQLTGPATGYMFKAHHWPAEARFALVDAHLVVTSVMPEGDAPVIEWPSKAVIERFGPNGRNWKQGGYGDVAGDGPVCLYGAVRACSPVPGDAYLIERVESRRGRGTSWNDSHEFGEVREWVEARQAITDGDLAVTFGPQWRYVVSLVRSAAALTEDQVEELAAAGAAAGDAARAAARAAAVDAARAAARAAAGAAARAAAGAAARAAAGDAARALVTRDLIGQRDYTQEHYDTLMGPWVSVMGEVEPCDVPEGD